MLYTFLAPLAPWFGPLNLFTYISVRSLGAVLTALALSLWLGPKLINWLKRRQGGGQPIRSDGPRRHLAIKQGTPTMGGILIVATFFASALLWADLGNLYVMAALALTLAFAVIGMVDDALKLARRTSRGISGKLRLALEFLVAAAVVAALRAFFDPELAMRLHIPFFKDVAPALGILALPFAAFVITGCANAVNLTDGLDGLAIVPAMIAFACFALVTWLVGHAVIASYLYLPFVPGAGELTILCAAMVGAGLGFLWFNAPPAQVFMGDSGALAVGAALGSVAVFARHELVLAIVGGLFVMETLSVMIQVVSYKMTGKRVFLMAPLHHHFEEKGWSEATIVIRFWIIAAVLALVGLATVKLR